MTRKDEIIYTLVLVSSVAVGFLIRGGKNSWQKQVLSTCLGLMTLIGLCGCEVLYSFTTILGTICIIKSRSRQTPLLAFIFVFSFLLFFRCSTIFGLPPNSAVSNAAQLILTLKLISVAIEIHDLRSRRQETSKSSEKENVRFQLLLEKEPSAFDVFCYSYCYVGLFTGPFFKFRTYQDFLQQSSVDVESIPWREEVIDRMKHIGLYATFYVLASLLFSIDYVKSDEFYDHGFWYRLFYMVPIFFIGRMRFYSAWLAAECSFITAAFGAYPRTCRARPGHGPTVPFEDPMDNVPFKDRKNDEEIQIQYSFETVRNINPGGSDWSSTVREGMRSWNMTVQWWLANYVHKRWPNHLKPFRTAAVLGCSAYWHGIAPGYFGAFLTMPFVMAAEDMMVKTVKKRLPENMHDTYDW